MQDYVNTIWKRPSIQKLIKENKDVNKKDYERHKWRTKAPRVTINHKGTWAAAWYENNYHRIDVEPWYADGGPEVKSTLRHEIVHALLDGCLGWINRKHHNGSDPHRKEFKNLLKELFPRTYQTDMYWHGTPRNMKEREKWIKKAS